MICQQARNRNISIQTCDTQALEYDVVKRKQPWTAGLRPAFSCSIYHGRFASLEAAGRRPAVQGSSTASIPLIDIKLYPPPSTSILRKSSGLACSSPGRNDSGNPTTAPVFKVIITGALRRS